MSLEESLYREHLEELSALYEQRKWLMGSRRLSWVDFIGLNRRIEPHLDALVIGEEAALSICAERMVSGDSGECYGAARVMVRQAMGEMMIDLIGRMGENDDERLDAVTDALCHEPLVICDDRFIHTLLDMDAGRARVAVRIISFHRLDYAVELYDALECYTTVKPLVIDALEALGRLRPKIGVERLLNYLHRGDNEMADAAITAMVRIGERSALKECMMFIGPSDWPRISLGLYGDKDALTDSFFSVSNLTDGYSAGISPDHVIAAGLIGNVAQIPDLINWLDIPELAESAALSLCLITGMEFVEEIFEPESIHEDELFEDEIDAWKSNTLYPVGEAPGRTVSILSLNPLIWKTWWERYHDSFDSSLRYRNGKPYSPEGLVGNLKSVRLPDFIRKLAYEELVIRYGIDFPFDVQMTAEQQLHAIEMYMIRLKNNPDGFQDGAWYYNGRLIEEDKETADDTRSDDEDVRKVHHV